MSPVGTPASTGPTVPDPEWEMGMKQSVEWELAGETEILWENLS
jgi:hypothetical protein